MMVRMRVVLLLLTSVTASRKLNGVEVQNSNNTLEERYAEAEAIVKNFVNQAKEESHTQLPTDRGEYQLSTNDEPASHDLHMDSTASQALLERKREGTTKIGKKDSKDKGDKAKAEKTGKGAKVKKGPGSGKSNSKNRAADEPTGAPSTTPSPTTTHRPSVSASPSAAPSITSSPTTTHRPTASTSPSVAPSYPPSTTATIVERDSSETIPHVSRLIPAFKLGHTTSQFGTPDTDDYAELAEITLSYLQDSLNALFSDVENVVYIGTEMEFYYIRGVYLVEYQVKTKWGIGGLQVPSIAELSIVTNQFFESPAQQSYVDRLNAELPASNVFGSTMAITLGGSASATVVEEGGSAPAHEDSPEPRNNTIMAASIAAAGSVSIVLILAAVFFRRRRGVGETEDDEMKPDGTLCTSDTSPMIPPNVSIHEQRPWGDDETTDGMDQRSAPRQGLLDESEPTDQHFQEIRLTEV